MARTPKIGLDDNVDNADWTKRTWDLPRTRQEMMSLLPDRKAVDAFLKLPVAIWNPDVIEDLGMRGWYAKHPDRELGAVAADIADCNPDNQDGAHHSRRVSCVRVEVFGLPPKKDGANSMWRKTSERQRILGLRRRLFSVLRGHILDGPVALELEIRISEDALLSAGDLDNFVTGVCDSLMPASGDAWRSDPAYSTDVWADVDPGQTIAIRDDAAVVSLLARKLPTFREAHYTLVLRSVVGPPPEPGPYFRSRQPTVCPCCSSEGVVPVVCGSPSPDLFESAERGEMALGGCERSVVSSAWRCLDCGTPVYRSRDRALYFEASSGL